MPARKMKGAWWVDFRFKGERFRQKSPVDTKRGAEEYERQLRAKLLEGKETPRTQTFATFSAEFMATYARTNNKPSEVETKQMILDQHLVPAFGNRGLDEIDVRAIEAYKASKVQPEDPKARALAPKTVNNHLTVLRKVLDTAVEWKLLSHVPKVQWLKAPEPEFDFLDFDEAPRLVTGADAGAWRTMILLGLRTGLRQGELLALRWEDVDLTSRKLVVRRSVTRGVVGTPKSGKSREVPLSDETLTALRGQRAVTALRGELVFCAPNGALLKKNECKWPLWRACRKAGLRRIGWHVLRHTFASHLAMRGVPLKVIQELLGHATIEMTMRYAHLAPAVHRDAVALLDGVPKPAPMPKEAT